MAEAECKARAVEARVARLATTRADGRVDLVPIVFAFVESRLVFAVDHKPKRTTNLQRLANIEANPHVTVLFDCYVDDDWDALWWVRMRGWAQVAAEGPITEQALDGLQARYPQHKERRPDGPVVVVTPTAWTGWASFDPTDLDL